MDIQNTNVMITGANRGIGLALATLIAKEKAHLHLVVRSVNEDLKKDLLTAGALSVKIWQADLSSRDGVNQLLKQIGDQQIDILVNNAGLLTGGLIENQTEDEIYTMFQVNLLSVIHLTRGLLPQMIKRGTGKIVNNSSVSAIMRFPCASTYAASKAAVLAFTECIQTELIGTGVSTISLITPGIKTQMFDDIEKKYGPNLKVPQDSISSELYAVKICDAIKQDAEVLKPDGTTAIGLTAAKLFPKVFRWAVRKSFKR